MALAEFDQARADFDHPAAHRPDLQDLIRATWHAGNIRVVNDPETWFPVSRANSQYRNIDAGKIKQAN